MSAAGQKQSRGMTAGSPKRPSSGKRGVRELELELRKARKELQNTARELKGAHAQLRSANKKLQATVRGRNVRLRPRAGNPDAEMQKAYEIARIERQRLFGVLETLPVYLVLLTPDYHVPFANRFFRDRFGESHGRRCFEYLFGRSEPCEICETFGVLRTHAPHRWEWIGPDSCNYDVYDFPFTDSDGSPLILEMGIDVTETKKAQSALREINETLERRVAERAVELVESEARLARAQEIARLGSWELDLVKNELKWSDEVYRILGLQPQASGATYEAFLGRVFAEDRAAVESCYRGSLREGRAGYEIEHRIVCADTGEIRWVQDKCQHIRDSTTGRCTRSIGMVLDITERRKAKEALEHSMRRFELLAATAGELLRSTSPQTIVESLCRKVMDYLDCHVFFNFLADEKSGRLHLNACAGIPAREAASIEWLDYGVAICGCVALEGRRIVAEHIPTTPDERTDLVKSYGIKAFACHPLLAPDGRVIGTLSFGTRSRETFGPDDLSLMKAVADHVATAMIRMQGEQVLRQTAEELARSNRDLEQFAYVSSHDLREPLRTISGFVQILQERYRDKLDARANEYIRFVVDGARRMEQLINDLLAYSRVGSGAAIKNWQAQKSVDAALNALKGSIEESQARILVDPMPTVPADGTLLTLVFQNLVGNAIKFRSQVPPEIQIGARKEEKAWVFWVKDNGIGLSREYSDKIFAIFRRLHTRGKYPGTGIGLAICKKIVEQHGGSIWVESEPGQGAAFYFSLPARR
jgi:PAS domain S-box-containing protein